ncbi:hypothetical protein [Actinoplanes sp. HUAS TT8]|uniref:hypothetical protein n=1 Tax=Actinoplanes sp. HUAS TT8 TaxID=3447453 RepID=UPI003F521D90
MLKLVTADQLTLVSVVDRWFCLDEPTFIDVGQSYWIDREVNEFCVDRGGDRLTRHAGRMCR